MLAHEIRRYHCTQQRDLDREVSLEDVLAQSSQRLGEMLADSGPSPSARASQREQEVLLADVLAKLPGDYREVIILPTWKDSRTKKSPGEWGGSTGAARMLWVRALASLRSAMEKQVPLAARGHRSCIRFSCVRMIAMIIVSQVSSMLHRILIVASGDGAWVNCLRGRMHSDCFRVANCEESASAVLVLSYASYRFRNIHCDFLDLLISSGRINASAAWIAAV